MNQLITYKDNIDNIDPEMLEGFFNEWKNYPTPEKLLAIIQNSEYKILAIDKDRNMVVGFINALSDRVLSAYIPLLEVLPEYQHQGIGSELVQRMMEKLKNHYMIDLVCDESLEKFYNKFGMIKYSGMIKRNYNKQTGKEKSDHE